MNARPKDKLRRSTKGDSISESFSVWLKSAKKGSKSHPEHYPPTLQMFTDKLQIYYYFQMLLLHMSMLSKRFKSGGV